jgi:opacity protein-like surface antigen
MTIVQQHGSVALAVTLILCLGAARASAQATPPQSTPASSGYVEFVANSTFGNVTSQAYGGEIGYRVWNEAQLYVEGGVVRNAATSSLSNAAQTIAGALGQLQPAAVSYSVKQPVSYFSAGIRYPLSMQAKVIPYVIAGFGLARVKKDVSFQIASSEPITQYVTLGEDLNGSENSPLLNVGAGIAWPAWGQHLVIDFQFRVMRVFAEDEGMNIGRGGVGVGFRF